jgi:hypothetical protein
VGSIIDLIYGLYKFTNLIIDLKDKMKNIDPSIYLFIVLLFYFADIIVLINDINLSIIYC